jgi:hypothetical protein
MEKIKSALKFIKENINLLILIPTLLGGFWQLFELSLIDTSFIRFFSISQVVADGLVISFLLSLFLLIYFLIFFRDKEEVIINNDLYSKKWFKIVVLVISIILTYEAIVTVSNNPKISTIHIMLVIGIILFCFKVFKDILVVFFGDIINKLFILITLVILIHLMFFKMDVLYKNFHNMYYIPSNIKNIEYLECHLGKPQKDFEILYFNDKYIFVKFKETKQIEILNFEELLKKGNCK